jgi:hypothetical protein
MALRTVAVALAFIVLVVSSLAGKPLREKGKTESQPFFISILPAGVAPRAGLRPVECRKIARMSRLSRAI